LPVLADFSTTDVAVSGSQLLSGLAVFLLVFVSGGVIYLSAAEWRDRRRRARAEKGVARSARRP
jgi:hypothetical protein